MCNHYRLHPEALSDWAVWAGFRKAKVASESVLGEMWPKRSGIVAHIVDGERRLARMRWGVPLTLPGKRVGTSITKSVTNVRVLTSPFWRATLAAPAQRCLIPFSRFAEPSGRRDSETGRQSEQWFEVNGVPVAAFAGIWRPSDIGDVYAFLTCEPNSLVKMVHIKAMPVILMPVDYDRWLTGTSDDAKALQAPFPSQLMAVCGN